MPVEVRIDQGRLARMLRARGGPAERMLRRRTERVAGIAERLAPGSMSQRISWTVTGGRSGLQGVIICDHPAVNLVLQGTRPHLIRPRRRKALRFEAGGGRVFAKVVRHPGTRPNNFMGAALRAGG